DPPDNEKLNELWIQANEALTTVRIVADAMVASYFAHESNKARKTALEDLVGKIPAWLATGQFDAELRGMVDGFREGAKAVPAFYWDVEFPEVFPRENPGFDCIVGNPPFMKGGYISASFGTPYLDWLLEANEQSHGNSDLVA